ncbi:restriction endonuclease subunit S [Commensalibacter communis]|uniref:restriction endonuclease subunit S n=1 Tax=Commensalibacter communis TaxID=2972786 RepID=UPI00232BA1C3|nr:restriction endonuclease subunit S [Commensalibacter communis]
MEGLEIAIINKSFLENSSRIDAEFYQKKFIADENVLKMRNSSLLSDHANFLIGPFGSAFTVDNYTSDTTYRYIRGKDVKPMRLQCDDNVYMPKDDYNRLVKYALKENDILLSVVGTVGNAAIVKKENLPAIFSCKSTVVRVRDIYPEYLLTFLNCKYGRELLLRKERGAIQKGLNLDDLKELLIYNASQTLQLKTKEILQLSQKKEKTSNILYQQAEDILLEELGLTNFIPTQQAVNIKSIKESFEATGRLDAEYYQPKYEEIETILSKKQTDTIEKICSYINYGTVPTSPYAQSSTSVPYIKGMNLNNLEVTNNLDHIENVGSLSDKYFTKEGDIIISQMGTVGNVGVITSQQEGFTFASFTIRVRIRDKTKYCPYYVGLYIQNIAKEWYLLRNIAQASVRQNTDLPTIKNMRIPYIEFKKQQEISVLIQQSFALKSQSEQLLTIAKQAVEMAIEFDEETAMQFIKENTNNIDLIN